MSRIGKAPIYIGKFDMTLTEVMYYLYLPIRMEDSRIKLPPNVEVLRCMVEAAICWSSPRTFKYIYLSARKGWATPDSPLNRPGWHCDGYGTPDINFVWWTGPGTRFAVQPFYNISADHLVSLLQFEAQIVLDMIVQPPEKTLWMIDAQVVHSTPIIEPPGCMRQYVKISLSDEKYNLYGNSHNYAFDYDWPMVDRALVRNDTYAAQQDFVKEST